MTGQRRWLKIWARTVGMPIGINDEDKPEFLPIKQIDVKKAIAFRTFWILLHVLTCFLIIATIGDELHGNFTGKKIQINLLWHQFILASYHTSRAFTPIFKIHKYTN